MKKIMTAMTLLAFVIWGAGLLSAQSQDDAKFKKFLDTYLDTYFKFFPTQGTLAGYTKYNDKLEDLSGGTIEKFHEGLDGFNQELVTKVSPVKDKMSPDVQLELEMIRDAMDLEFMKFENLLPWEYNPLFYNDIILNSIRGLLAKETAPLEARVKSATERAKQIPGLIKKAKDNLKTPAQLYTEVAIAQMPAIINFYSTEVPNLVSASAGKAALQAEIGKAVTALEDYQRFLKNELLAKSTGNFRLGDQAHLRLMRLTSQGNVPMDELVARAKADANNLRREMFLVCIPFYRIMYPNTNLEQLTTQRGEEEVRNIVIKAVFDKIKSDHATKEDFFNKIKTKAEAVKAFTGQTGLFEVPSNSLTIVPMPLPDRGVTWWRLVTPGAYESGSSFTMQVMPIPDDWSAEQANAFLEEYNNLFLDFVTIQKIFPGNFVPALATRKDPSLVKKLFPNQALLKGWPVYTEEMFVYAGFGNYDLRLRLSQLKRALKTVMDFNLELNIHQGGMTKEQAVNYMTRVGFQSEGEAERKWNHIILNPGEAAMPYIGYQEILDLEKDYKKLKGESFNQKEFLQKLVSYGALPLRALKTKLTQ